jgi:hypothetical protein
MRQDGRSNRFQARFFQSCSPRTRNAASSRPCQPGAFSAIVAERMAARKYVALRFIPCRAVTLPPFQIFSRERTIGGRPALA